MTSIALSTASTVAAVPTATSTTSTSKLVQLANGEYTAASVSADQADATKLGLQKEKDGNYGTKTPAVAGGSATSSSSSGVLAALTAQTLGGS